MREFFVLRPQSQSIASTLSISILKAAFGMTPLSIATLTNVSSNLLNNATIKHSAASSSPH